MESIWTATEKLPAFDALRGEVKTDVLIVGGGITGILCAYMLKNAGADCALVEAERIAGGVTQNTTAKITVQHGLIYEKIYNRYGTEYAQLYYLAQSRALEKYRELCSRMDCDFEVCDSYVYARDKKERLERELETLRKLHCPAAFVETQSLPLKTVGAIRIRQQAQFHPLKFIRTIVSGLKIYENTRVLDIQPGGVRTSKGKIKAKAVIVATHFPFINKHGGYFLKMHQHRSYVLALKNVPSVRGMYVDASDTGLSFRESGGLLLLGGGGHRTGKSGGNWRELSDFAKRHFPESDEVYRWATQDCMTLDGMPYIGQYGARTPSLYVATGFNKWGMTSAMNAAMLLTDAVLGKENECAKVFSPQRSIWHPQLLKNAASSVVGLLTPTVPRCPHLGCALKYNAQEHSWDCACHGSRFTKEGKVIENPANGNLK